MARERPNVHAHIDGKQVDEGRSSCLAKLVNFVVR